MKRSPVIAVALQRRRSATKLVPWLTQYFLERLRMKPHKSYAAHLQSAHFREVKRQVRVRSRGRCERIIQTMAMIAFREGTPYRCPNSASVFCHISYSKLPNEPASHVEHLCKECSADRMTPFSLTWGERA